MKVAVWDTYVSKKDGTTMHFDIIVPAELTDTVVIFQYGRDYVASKGQTGQLVSAKECQFCHFESLRPEWEDEIKNKGYFVIELENCS